EPVVKALEGGYDMFKTFATKGVDGIWEFLKDKFSDLKEVVIDAIKDMLITQVIQAGIKWLLSLLIPGAGFIKAIMAIKDLIVFFVESAMMLIPAITEAILALAAGSIAGVAKAIEFGLAKLIGLVINLFAKLIGLGGLSKKVQAIFKKIRKRVDKAVGKLLKKARKAGRKLMGKLGIGTKEKPKNKEQHDQQVKAGMLYLHQQEKALDKDGNRSLTPEEANKVAAKTKKKFAVFTSITPKIVGGKWVYHWTGSQGDEDGLKASLESGDLHDSVISYSPGSFNGATMGTDTNASILTKKGPSGTEPTKAKHAIFDDLLFRRDGGRSYYVRGHLLNQKLHGSGKWENMTPLSQKGNQDHERDAESKVKKAVDAGKTVEYTIKPVYGRGKLETPEDADPKLKEIRDAEQYVPTGVTVFAQVISLEDGKIKRVNFKSDYFESN
ncbi:MAG: DNA/RNA non-specific endonuclease, partial [Fluviicola sp.]